MPRFLLIVLWLAAAWWGCKKESDPLQLTPLTAYYPLQAGSRFTYRLDSTIYINFGSASRVVSYTAKDSIVSTFTDNEGRTAYLVYRYLSDTLMQQPFVYNSAYYITPTTRAIEVTDAYNLHFIKLVQPVSQATTWDGNVYIDAQSPVADYSYLYNWVYTYQNINQPYTVLQGTIDSTVTVLQTDVTQPDDSPFDPQYFKQRIYSTEVYGKGIGLIWKELTYWTWQPSDNINPGHFADGSYGIKMNLISYSLP